MKSAIVLGSGMVGATIAADLHASGLAVTVADKRPEALAAVAEKHRRVQTVAADLADPAIVRRIVADHDIVVGALPSFLGLAAMRAIIEAGKPLCDISFLAEDPAAELGPLAEARGVTVVYDAGVSPGMSNLLIGRATAAMDACDRIEILVGGLPEVRRWPFQHKVAFSPGDLIEEYVRPARMVEHGEIVIREALSEPELIDFPGVGTLEAFNTDGLRSLLRTHAGVPTMREKTLRYPGHVELMRVFRATGLFSEEAIEVRGQRVRPIDLTAALLFPKITFAEGEVDLTVLRVTIEGRKKGERVQERWELFDRYDPATETRSMSRTTGYTASIVAQMMVEGRFVRPGVHPPEVVGREPGLTEEALREMEKRGVRYRETSML